MVHPAIPRDLDITISLPPPMGPLPMPATPQYPGLPSSQPDIRSCPVTPGSALSHLCRQWQRGLGDSGSRMRQLWHTMLLDYPQAAEKEWEKDARPDSRTGGLE
ncbi:hypothetical protein VSDG_08922 [Cytospora chrysosperma]|uniref:Uncharacterized protein n=1 Tax=Cytospora chrysosperma TaxID=252740 RepID=A0A423VD40_CYTCH|nr:hypothetical protein VSDG_08922 [Valsa sordida]